LREAEQILEREGIDPGSPEVKRLVDEYRSSERWARRKEGLDGLRTAVSSIKGLDPLLEQLRSRFLLDLRVYERGAEEHRPPRPPGKRGRNENRSTSYMIEVARRTWPQLTGSRLSGVVAAVLVLFKIERKPLASLTKSIDQQRRRDDARSAATRADRLHAIRSETTN
jgi:hypothetical protein